MKFAYILIAVVLIASHIYAYEMGLKVHSGDPTGQAKIDAIAADYEAKTKDLEQQIGMLTAQLKDGDKHIADAQASVRDATAQLNRMSKITAVLTDDDIVRLLQERTL
jgi:hypothetical protein